MIAPPPVAAPPAPSAPLRAPVVPVAPAGKPAVDPAAQARLQPAPSPTEPYSDYFTPRRRRHRLARIALVLLLLAASGAGGYFWFGKDAPATPVGALEVGTFVLSSQPPGADVLVDGVAAGITPLALQLTPGTHTIVATGPNGIAEQLSATVQGGESLSRHLVLEAPAPAPVALEPSVRAVPRPPPASAAAPAPATAATAAPVPPASGYVTFALPFDVQVFENGTFLGSNSGERLRVSPGSHTFTLVNEQLGFRAEETVVVGAGRSIRRVINQPSAALSVNAVPWAEVLISGRSFGETPLANISLPLGTYQVTLRHPTFGEREVGVTVRAGAPNRLAVDMRK